MQSWYQEVLQNIFLACPQSQYNFIILTSDIKILILKLLYWRPKGTYNWSFKLNKKYQKLNLSVLSQGWIFDLPIELLSQDNSLYRSNIRSGNNDSICRWNTRSGESYSICRWNIQPCNTDFICGWNIRSKLDFSSFGTSCLFKDTLKA